MKLPPEKLKSILVEPGYLTLKQFQSSMKLAAVQKRNVADVIAEKGFLKDSEIDKLIAQSKGYNFISLKRVKLDNDVLEIIPEIVARSQEVVAFGIAGNHLKVGMRNPDNLDIIHLIEKRAGMPVAPYYITTRDLDNALTNYHANLREEFDTILKRLQDKTFSNDERDEETVKMVDTLLMFGYRNKASDIHIEPYAKKIMVRFRIDGVMHDVVEIPKRLLECILTRIKILSKMRVDEHRAAQDGKLQFSIPNGNLIDVRVSIIPITGGENVVMRLLSAKIRQFNLVDLGLSRSDLQKIKRAIKNFHGMILVTGPTGSGKTTTLYAILKILNTRDVHISTIEDPVEYDIEGVSQIQVNTKANLTFATGLRAIVRQDPDIIMVGEIRDKETAGMAVNSAMTGHLVLSTLHANDAATTLPRLLDMGIESFLIASTINVTIAQRLIRKICQKCRASYKLTPDEKQFIKNDPRLGQLFKKMEKVSFDTMRIYRGKGCSLCGYTGYRGRIGIFEILMMTNKINGLIMKHATSDEIESAAKEEGMTTMFDDGIDKVLQGITTLEEVLRVTSE